MKRLFRNIKNTVFGRFLGVGTISTLIDFITLFTLQQFGLPVIAANLLSTTAGFCFSFYANKRFTFKTSGTSVRRELLLFVIVTLTGIWVLQNIIISLVMPLLTPHFNHEVALLGSKLIATGFSMVWNYVFYKRLVFRHSPVTNVVND